MLFSGFSFRNDAWAITIKTTREPRTFGRSAYCYSCQKEKDIFFVHFAGFFEGHSIFSCISIMSSNIFFFHQNICLRQPFFGLKNHQWFAPRCDPKTRSMVFHKKRIWRKWFKSWKNGYFWTHLENIAKADAKILHLCRCISRFLE